MTTPRVIPIPEQAPRPTWTVTRPDRPSSEGLQAIVRLCVAIAQQELAADGVADGADEEHRNECQQGGQAT